MNFPFQVAAAPMAGISVRAYRDIVREFGADVAYGEMISARAIGYGNKKTWELLDIENEDSPRLVQISASEPYFLAQAAELAAELGAEYIDLNMGCPVPKVVRNHEGSSLMQDMPLAEELIKTACKSGKPVSVKIRAGWDDNSINGVEMAKMAEQAGAWCIAVHGRTRQQFYSGHADWNIIAKIKQAVSVPVIGNGDIFSAEDAVAMMEQTNCDGVMIGRGMLGNPWLFREVKAALENRPLPQRPNAQQVLEVALRHLRHHVQRCIYWVGQRDGVGQESARLGEDLAVRSLRGHLGWYTKGLRGSASLRHRITQLTSVAEIEQVFTDYMKGLSEDGLSPEDMS